MRMALDMDMCMDMRMDKGEAQSDIAIFLWGGYIIRSCHHSLGIKHRPKSHLQDRYHMLVARDEGVLRCPCFGGVVSLFPLMLTRTLKLKFGQIARQQPPSGEFGVMPGSLFFHSDALMTHSSRVFS